jgi:hypothetical protein
VVQALRVERSLTASGAARLTIAIQPGFVTGALAGRLRVRDGPFPFPRARFDPAQAGRVLRDRGVRLACVGHFGHVGAVRDVGLDRGLPPGRVPPAGSPERPGRRVAFALLVPAPAIGIAAMARLRALPEAGSLAGVRG